MTQLGKRKVGIARDEILVGELQDKWHVAAPPAAAAAAMTGPAPQSFATLANADFAILDPFQVNGDLSGRAERPTVTRLASGGFVVAWERDSGIRLQLFDANGDKLGSEVVVGVPPGAALETPASIAALTAGGFVVTWAGIANATFSDSVDVWMQRFDATGHSLGGAIRANTTFDNNQQSAHAAGLSDGGYVVVWSNQTNGNQGSDIDIVGRRFDANGAPVGGEFTVNTTTNFYQTAPFVAALPNGGFVVTWHNAVQPYFVGQIFDASGAKAGGEFRLDLDFDSTVAVTVLANGNIVVAGAVFFGELMGQMFSPTGAAIGSPFQINTVTADRQDMPALTALPDGGFVASWRQANGNISFFQDGEIKAQIFDATGAKVGGEFMVNPDVAGGQALPVVVAFGSGDFGIVWSDYPDSTNVDVQMRLYFSALHGDESANSFGGTAGRDFYDGRGGADTIQGGDGDDVLDGGDGDDVIYGGSQTSLLFANDDNVINGGAGDDRIYGAHGDDKIDGGTGNDLILDGLGGNNIVDGGDGDDEIELTGSNNGGPYFTNTVIGGLGNDRIILHDSNGSVAAGVGNDYVRAERGVVTIDGGDGNDEIVLGQSVFQTDGVQTATGGAGADLF